MRFSPLACVYPHLTRNAEPFFWFDGLAQLNSFRCKRYARIVARMRSAINLSKDIANVSLDLAAEVSSAI